MSPQLSCGNTCQIWAWYPITNMYFGDVEKIGKLRNGGNRLSNPHPWSVSPYGIARPQWVNSLRPSDAIWRQWSWTTLAQVMACCLTAPSHYLNQCWLIIRGVLWHTSESSFAGIAQGIDSGYEFEKDILKNIFKSPRGQWVNGVCHPASIAGDTILTPCHVVKSLDSF